MLILSGLRLIACERFRDDVARSIFNFLIDLRDVGADDSQADHQETAD